MDYSKLPLMMREKLFRLKHRTLEQPPYAVAWEDPDDLDAPAQIMTISPWYWAMALHGGILPPVWVWWELAKDEAKPDFKHHTRDYLIDKTPPLGPMTEEEAVAWFIMKDIPPRVWRDYKGNRTILKIAPRHLFPTDRTFRNAWRVSQEA